MPKTSQLIINYIKKQGWASGQELADYFGISDRAVRKQLKKLSDNQLLAKAGRPPKVYYLLPTDKNNSLQEPLDKKTEKFINDNYLIITPTGEIKNGLAGFSYWCEKNKLPLKKTAAEYLNTLKKYARWKKNGLIDGMIKLKNTFNKVGLDDLYYLDFYGIERFGKTKLGQMLLYAKQSQNKLLIKELVLDIQPSVKKIVKKYKIDGAGFIPPTVKREVQFMKELKKTLNLNVKNINLVKIKTAVVVPQKTLNKLNDRIENARQSIIVDDNGKYKNILLIDDAVGSGATMNETALQIKKRKLCSGKIIGLAITGSFKGFEIISEI